MHQHCNGRRGRPENIPTEADPAGQRATVRRALSTTRGRGSHCSKYITPTSSFAGGRHGTLIFATVSGESRGDGLLRAHHDAVIQPLLKRENRPASHASSSSIGKRNYFIQVQNITLMSVSLLCSSSSCSILLQYVVASPGAVCPCHLDEAVPHVTGRQQTSTTW